MDKKITTSKMIAIYAMPVLLARAPTTSAAAGDFVDEIPEVNAGTNELGAGSLHRFQKLFAALIDQCHVGEVDNAFAAILCTEAVPIRLQFRDPRPGQPALQDPALLVVVFGHRDS